MFTKKFEKLISTGIALCSLVALLYLAWLPHNAFGSISDFPEYYASARLVVTGDGAASYLINNIAAEEHKFFPSMGSRLVLLFIPPQGLMLISPLGLLNPTVAFYLWKIFLIFCLIGSVVFLVRVFSLDYKKTCYLVAGLCLSQMVYESLRIDQLAPILLFAFSAALYFLQGNKDIKAGLVLSLMICKPQCIIPFMAYLAGLRRWRPIIIVFSVLLFLTGLAYFIIGSEGFLNYFALLRLPESLEHMHPELMPTFRGQLIRLWPTYAKEIMYLSGAIYMAVVVISYFYGGKNKDKDKNVLLSTLLVMPIGLIASVHCHSYDLLLLVPTMVAIFTGAVYPFSQSFKILTILGAIIFMVPVAVIIHYDYLLKGGQFNVWFIELFVLSLFLMARVTFCSKES